MSESGIIFNIQRFTIHDGPGMRTEIFLKGCPMRCPWCGNPESHKAYIQPGVYESKCLSAEKCGLCLEVCPVEGALLFREGRLYAIDGEKCSRCMECASACPLEAVKQWGVKMTAEDCMKVVLRDRDFYTRSGGGVTVSGGEPLLQRKFVEKLFKLCGEEGIHTCCETTLYASWSEVKGILPYTELFISDIKHMDSRIHRKYTGVGNELILENLNRLTEEKKELILRIPVIPGVNDDMENMKRTGDFIEGTLKGRVRALQLLSFMRLGEEKYRSLNIPYEMKELEIKREELQKRVNEAREYFSSRGIRCFAGAREKE